MKFTKLAVFTLPLVVSNFTYAAKCNVDLELKKFKEDPKTFLNKAVPKRDANCGTDTFKYNFAADVDVIAAKDAQRSTLCHTDEATGQKVCLKDIEPGQDVQQGRAPIEGVDRAENLVSGSSMYRNIYDMEQAGLTTGAAKIKPWSDWYWPIYVGQLSYRYADNYMKNAFESSGLDGEKMWSFMKDWHKENPTKTVRSSHLSPAEKYDLLVGDKKNLTMTRHMLERPEGFSKGGKVAAWMGICHGWAPAAYMLPRPVSTITVKGVGGVEVEFKPTDLKALASQLWATGSQQTKFIGGRCNTKDPKTDRNGRILDQKCFDNNPGTWHMAVVNQLGKNKLSFVMDATYDIEVWNHPVTSYSYTYFNPETMEEYSSLENAIVSMRNFRSDKFSKYRSRNAKSVVGVKMEVEYLVETMPNTYDFDVTDLDAHNTAYYVYDLELDVNNEIIGGEWYTNKHPDFLWTPYDGSHATSNVDSYIDGKVTVDNIGSIRGLTRLAQRASNQGQPIGKIVEALLEAASEVKAEDTLVYERENEATTTEENDTEEPTVETPEEEEVEEERPRRRRGRFGRMFRRIFRR